MIECVLAIAATGLGAGLYMWLPDGHKKWGVALSALSSLLFIYALMLVLFPPTLSLDFLQIGLYSNSQVEGMRQRPEGTYVFVTARIRNRGEDNSAVDWECLATTGIGQTYSAIMVDSLVPVRMFPDNARAFQLGPADQLVEKSTQTLTKGKWISGYFLFFFSIPKSELHLPGTVFILRCRDVVHNRLTSVEFNWSGKDDAMQFYPGLKYQFLPTASPTK